MKQYKIFLKEWMAFKPYNNHSNVDNQYLAIANKVNIVLQDFTFLKDQLEMDVEEVKELAVFLTCYLEDVVSNTNIWNTFVLLNYQKYQKPIPFYKTVDYVDKDINKIDIQFLIWYFLNMTERDRFLSPYDEYLEYLVQEVFEVLNKEYEYVSENNTLQKHYELALDADYYQIRKHIQKYFFESYLFAVDTKRALNIKFENILSENDNESVDQNYLEKIFNSLTDELTLNYNTKLLANYGKDWLKEIIGSKHKLYTAVNSISEKISGYFFYKGENKLNIIFEHIATEKIFELTKDSYNGKINSKEDTIYYLEMVNFDNEWLFSGVTMQLPFNANLILDEKNSLRSRNKIMSHEKVALAETKAVLKKQEKAFIECFGASIHFTDNIELKDEINKFHEFYNSNYTTAFKEETLEQAKQRNREKGFFETEKITENFDFIAEIVLYFNPNVGLEIYDDIADIFPVKKNPFFIEDNSLNVKQFLFSSHYSKEITRFYIENYASKVSFFKNETGKKYLKDLDFLIRFWKNENYNQNPKITLI